MNSVGVWTPNCGLNSIVLFSSFCVLLCGCENGPRIREIPGVPGVYVEYFPDGSTFGVFGASATTVVRDEDGKLLRLQYESSSGNDFWVKRPVYSVELRSVEWNRERIKNLVKQLDHWSNDGAVVVISFGCSESTLSSAHEICRAIRNVEGIVGIHIPMPILDELLADSFRDMKHLEIISIMDNGSPEESTQIERLEECGIVVVRSKAILVNQGDASN